MLPDVIPYVPDPKNGRPIADGQVFFLLGGYTPPGSATDVNPAFIAEVTADGIAVPQPIFTSKGGTLLVGSQSNQPQLEVDPLVRRVAVYDKCGRLVYSTAYNGVGPFVSADALAATDSTTLVGGVEAGDIAKRISGEKSILEFGVVGDGIADDTAALNTAFESGRVNNFKIVGFTGAVCQVTDTIVINCNADLSGVEFRTASGFNKPVVRTSGDLAGADLLRDVEIKYPDVISLRVSPSSPTIGSVGIQIDSCRNNVFYIGRIYGYDDNVLFYSNDSAKYVSYNKINYTNLIAGSRRNLHFLTELTGWVNQCEHYGGQFAQFSNDAAVYDAANVKFTKIGTGGNNPPNGHTFIGCSMEGAFADGTIWQDYTVSTSFASNNNYVGVRFELSSLFRFSPIALGDVCLGCYGITASAIFDGGVKPLMFGFNSFNYENASSPAAGSATVRRNNFIPLFNANNTGSAAAVAAGSQGRMNGQMTGSGLFESFNPTNEALLWPVMRCGLVSGLPSIYLGDGTTNLSEYLRRWAGGQWRHNFSLVPADNNTRSLGAVGNTYANVYSNNFRPGTGTATWTSGEGSPEGAVTASVGSMYTRTDGGAGTTLYVKESGTGNTGWVAK